MKGILTIFWTKAAALLFTITFLASNAFGQNTLLADSVTVAIEPTYDEVSGTHRLLFGESYRTDWATPVKIKVLHLSQEKGGLTILQKGGGLQTKSLRLQDPSGQQWVLRTIQKYPERGLPPSLRPTIAKDILQDQVSASHPFAALTVPPLAQALGVPHANPQVVYVPDDPALGEYQKDFANQVFLLEEREPLDATDTDNTEKVQQRLRKDHDNRVDQPTVLRARLLDMLLGDYDRHEDQWRWKQVDKAQGSVYEPVPRDRDHVYYRPTGVLPHLLSLHLMMANTQGFNDRIRSINRWNIKARDFDRYFLNSLSEADWKAQIAYVQQRLSDSLIHAAVRRMPAAIYQLDGPEIERKLRARRDILDQQALKYYRFLARKVTVPASNQREQLAVRHLPGGRLQVIITKRDTQRADSVLYQRTFDPADTREVVLYGLGGKDQFRVTGGEKSAIKLRLVGGAGNDSFVVGPEVRHQRRLRLYDRADKDNTLPTESRARLRTSADTLINHYEPTGFRYDYLQPLFFANYNRDFGFQLIGNIIRQKQGFRKTPYSNRQSLLLNYGFAYQSLQLNYTGLFKQVLGKSDLLINAQSRGPNYSNFFFGVGNSTANTEDRQYYRSLYNLASVDVRLSHTYSHWKVSAGLMGQYYNSSESKNEDRLLRRYHERNPDEQVFESQTYAGAVAEATFDTRDRELVARRGIYWTTSLLGLRHVNGEQNTFGQVLSEFSFHLSPARDSGLVIANRTGLGTTIGSAAYFQQFKLGGNQNLRGFYLWRFTGKTIAYNNLEVRIKLLTFNSYLLPGTLGLVLFNDVGRVWTPGEESSRWHTGYGGGLYFLPAQLILVQAVVGASSEGVYPYISAGFRF